MSNATYWALKRREWASRETRPARRGRRNLPQAAARAAETVEAPDSVVIVEDPQEIRQPAEPAVETITKQKETVEIKEQAAPKPKAASTAKTTSKETAKK